MLQVLQTIVTIYGCRQQQPRKAGKVLSGTGDGKDSWGKVDYVAAEEEQDEGAAEEMAVNVGELGTVCMQ